MARTHLEISPDHPIVASLQQKAEADKSHGWLWCCCCLKLLCSPQLSHLRIPKPTMFALLILILGLGPHDQYILLKCCSSFICVVAVTADVAQGWLSSFPVACESR